MSSLLTLLLLAGGFLPAAEWQWTADADGVISSETKAPPRAFLWIPPTCTRVRAVVIGQHNMEEEPILEDPAFRRTLEDLGIAAIWITPALDNGSHLAQGAGDRLLALVANLARQSGYGELADAPVIPIGHSALASFPWEFAAWKPERTLAVLSVSGQWPYTRDPKDPLPPGWTVDGVPGLVAMGEYEWAESRANDGLAQRKAHPRLPLTMLAEPGSGHFAPTPAKIAVVGQYLRRAVAARLPAQSPSAGPVALIPVDPTTGGWLYDRWHRDQPPSAAAGPVSGPGAFSGDRSQAFWAFDREMAEAITSVSDRYRGRQGQLLGYVQNGAVVPQVNGTHQQVTLAWLPDADGITFHLTGTFLDTVPAGRPEKWVGQAAGSPIGHAAGSEPIRIERICGPVRRTGPDTFAIAFTRQGTDNPRRSNELWFVARHPGDARYRPAEQQAVLRFPLRNTVGADQTVEFPAIPDQTAGAGPIPLGATASSGLPVGYYVLAGPAEIEGDHLRLTSIPPRATLPITVTVVAWQWGRSGDPRVRTAVPVSRSFAVRP